RRQGEENVDLVCYDVDDPEDHPAQLRGGQPVGWMAVAGILDHRHEGYICLLVSKLTCHFQRDVGAEAPAADQVRTTGMNGSNRAHVASGDLRQAFRCAGSVHCLRLHRVKWTVWIHVVGEVVVAQHVASVGVNTEEGGLRTP